LYAISYILQTGTVVHRAKSATAAIEAMELLKRGGAAVIRVVATRNDKEVTVAELRLLAADEVASTTLPDRPLRRSGIWRAEPKAPRK
jgi:hypothetical protein